MRKANKKLASAIVLGLMLAVPVGASAAIVDYGDYNNSKPTEDVDTKICITEDGVSDVDLSNVSAEFDKNYRVFGLKVFNGAEFNYENDKIDISVENNSGNAAAVSAASFGSNGNNIDSGTILLKANDVLINAKGTSGDTVGLDARNFQGGSGTNPSKIEVSSKNLVINVESTNNAGYCAGIWAANYTNKTSDVKYSEVNIDSDNIIINATSSFKDKDSGEYYNIGVVAYSNGRVNIDGNLTINAGTAISARGNSVININEQGDDTVKINGDVSFNFNKGTSGTTVDADVLINLTNEDSYLNGNIVVTGNPPKELSSVNDMRLGLANGAQWTTDEDSFVNTLNFNDGIININGGKDHTVQLDKVEGTGGTVNIKAEIEDGGSVTSGKLNIGKKAEDTAAVNALFAENNTPKLDVNFTGVTADSFEDADAAKQALSSLAGNVSVTGGEQVSATATIKEGIVSGAVSGEMTFTNVGGAGNIEVKDIKVNNSTTTMDNMRDVASVALVAWRQEDSTLSQRLGELRNSEGDQGIWARMSRGEFEYGGAFKNQYNYFQLGYDWAAGDWHYGAAISHNDGQTTYASGSGENDSTSLTLYGTWLGDKGQYTDIVVKQGKLNNEFTNYAEAGTTTGDYDMWGTSISAEYGQKLEMKNDWYVTPQAQLTYMRIGGEDYTATVTKDGSSAPMYVSQDGMDSFVGRIGFEAGKNISEKGSIYAKASLLHEFAGEADTYLQLNDVSNSYSQDLGDTWYECGFGVNYKTSDSSYVYADVVKTFGGDVETPWQWNAGMRWSF